MKIIFLICTSRQLAMLSQQTPGKINSNDWLQHCSTFMAITYFRWTTQKK
jgi:hypothetical protein